MSGNSDMKMTPQEVAEVAQYCSENGPCPSCRFYKSADCVHELLYAAADIIRKLTAWRDPVDDPPAQFEPVLVCRVKDPDKPPIVEQGSKEPGGWWKVYGTRVKKILGWRPMPAGITPPAGRGGERE